MHRLSPANHLAAGRHTRRLIRYLLLALVGIVGSDSHAAAAEKFEVLAFATITTGEELTVDLDALGGLVQNPSLAKALVRVLADRSGVRKLPGLDSSRFAGVAVMTDGLRVAPLAFVPVTNARQLLDALANLIGPAVEQTELGENIWKVGRGVVTGYVCQRGDWAYMAQTADLFERVLTSQQIEHEFSQLPQGHDLALRLYPLRLPEALRTFGIDLLREQSDLAREQPAQEPDDATAARRRLHQLMLELCESALSDQQRVTWTWQFDRAAKQARLELEVVPAPDSDLARNLGACQLVDRPRLAVSEPCWLRGHCSLQVDPKLARQISEIADDLSLVYCGGKSPEAGRRSGEEAELAPWLQLLHQLAAPALRRGELVGDVVVTGAALPLTALIGLPAADSPSLDRLLDALQSESQSGPHSPQIDRHGGQIAGRPVHNLRLPRASVVERYFGEAPTCQLTHRPGQLLLAWGPQSNKALAQAVAGHNDRASASARRIKHALQPHFLLSMQAAGAVSVVSSALADRRQELLLSLVSANLRSADDRIVLDIKPAPAALRARLTLHEGVLRAVAMGLNLVALESLSKSAIEPPR